MAAEQIKLLAPNSLPIVGIRLEDDSICDFEYSYDKINLVRSFILQGRSGANILNRDGDHVLVDSAGNEWPASDVEFHSLLKD